MRTGGRCSSSCVIAGARKTTSKPAAQPNRTIDATPKTNESDTPPVSTPSTGTGKRAAGGGGGRERRGRADGLLGVGRRDGERGGGGARDAEAGDAHRNENCQQP